MRSAEIVETIQKMFATLFRLESCCSGETTMRAKSPLEGCESEFHTNAVEIACKSWVVVRFAQCLGIIALLGNLFLS